MFTMDTASGVARRPNRWMLHQAANDGFRGVHLVCFDGPYADGGPRGLVVFANGDNNATLLVAAVCRAVLTSPAAFSQPVAGFDLSRVPAMTGGFEMAGIKQEEIVNLGFKDLVLQAFEPAEAKAKAGASPDDAAAGASPSRPSSGRRHYKQAGSDGMLTWPGC